MDVVLRPGRVARSHPELVARSNDSPHSSDQAYSSSDESSCVSDYDGDNDDTGSSAKIERSPDPRATRHSERSAAKVYHNYSSKVHPNDNQLPFRKARRTSSSQSIRTKRQSSRRTAVQRSRSGNQTDKASDVPLSIESDTEDGDSEGGDDVEPDTTSDEATNPILRESDDVMAYSDDEAANEKRAGPGGAQCDSEQMREDGVDDQEEEEDCDEAANGDHGGPEEPQCDNERMVEEGEDDREDDEDSEKHEDEDRARPGEAQCNDEELGEEEGDDEEDDDEDSEENEDEAEDEEEEIVPFGYANTNAIGCGALQAEPSSNATAAHSDQHASSTKTYSRDRAEDYDLMNGTEVESTTTMLGSMLSQHVEDRVFVKPYPQAPYTQTPSIIGNEHEADAPDEVNPRDEAEMGLPPPSSQWTSVRHFQTDVMLETPGPYDDYLLSSSSVAESGFDGLAPFIAEDVTSLPSVLPMPDDVSQAFNDAAEDLVGSRDESSPAL